MTYPRIARQKNRLIDSLVKHFKKIMKILNALIFSFIILNLIKKGILDFHVTRQSGQWGINPPLQKHPTLIFTNPPLKSANCPSPPL